MFISEQLDQLKWNLRRLDHKLLKLFHSDGQYGEHVGGLEIKDIAHTFDLEGK